AGRRGARTLDSSARAGRPRLTGVRGWPVKSAVPQTLADQELRFRYLRLPVPLGCRYLPVAGTSRLPVPLGCRYLRLPRAPQPDKSPLGPKTCSSTRGTSQGQGRLSRVRATFPGPDDVRPRSPRVGGDD